MSGLTRRNFARALAATGLAMPLLRTIGLDPLSARNAYAGTTNPKRFVFWYIPDGLATWETNIGTKNGSGLTLGNHTLPLAPLMDQVVLIDHLAMKTPQVVDFHVQGMTLLLTGAGFDSACTPPAGQPPTKGCSDTGIPVLNGSIDQYLASKVPGSRSLQIAAQPDHPYTISYSGSGQSGLPPATDPVALYHLLFDGFTPPGDKNAATRLALRQSVLDTVQGDVAALQPLLGSADRQKLDQQLTAIRAMEARLSAVAPVCTKPSAPGIGGGAFDAANYGSVMDAHAHVLAAALTCGLANIATFQSRACYSELNLPSAGIPDKTIHGLSHDDFSGPTFVKAKAYHYQQLANFAMLLKNTKEGSGTALDNTLIVSGSDIGEGHEHDRTPWVTIGGKNMGVKTGQYLDAGGASHLRLLTSILNMFGLSDQNYGPYAQYGSGPLAGFTV